MNIKRNFLKNCKVLPTRDHLIADLPKNGVIAELGVFEGDFARRIFNYSNPKKMYLVDLWPKNKGIDGVKKLFEKEINENIVEIVQKDSIHFVQSFEDNYFDWVYLDTTHEYTQTLNELTALKNKIKKEGYIAGHDFCGGNPRSKTVYGVIPACHEFCLLNGWEYVYLTVDVYGHFSFCIRRMNNI